MLSKIVFAAIIFQFITAIDITKTNKKIKQLEEEKKELLKQIDEAIDESIKSLQKTNETEALIGIKYMYDLKEHLKRVNETVFDENDQKYTNISDIDKRRMFNNRRKTKSNYPDFESILRPKKISETKWKNMMNDRTRMQEQLNEWILKREKEKERLKRYRLYQKGMINSGKYEKCPRFGYHGKKKKERGNKVVDCKVKVLDFDREDNVECKNITKPKNDTNDTLKRDMKKSRLKLSKKKKYPCCRKCCKKSYMGCL